MSGKSGAASGTGWGSLAATRTPYDRCRSRSSGTGGAPEAGPRGSADRAHAEVAPGDPHPEQLARLDVATVHDHPAVGVLHHGVAPFERGERGQGPDLRPQVPDLVSGTVHAGLHPVAGPRGERVELLATGGDH